MSQGDILDEAHRGAHIVAVTFLSCALAGATEASGASAYVALGTMAWTVPNLTPGGPFERAGGEWETLATELEEKRNDLESIANEVRGGNNENLWKGDGAEAFSGYVDSELLPSIDALIQGCRDANTTLQSISSSCTTALVKFYAITITGTAFALAANALNAIPFVGPALAVAAKWYIAIGWTLHLIYDLFSLVMDVMSELGTQQALSAATDALADQFGREGDRLDSEALDRKRQEIDSILSDPGNWGKN